MPLLNSIPSSESVSVTASYPTALQSRTQNSEQSDVSPGQSASPSQPTANGGPGDDVPAPPMPVPVTTMPGMVPSIVIVSGPDAGA
jgi:hypothetical protein